MQRFVGHLRRQAVGYIALFIARGGTSYAAVSLPANSVGPKQLKNGAVTPSKLAAATARRFQGQRGLPGAAGPAGLIGLQGPKGDAGATGTTGSIGTQGPPGPFVATLPSGKTEEGAFIIRATAAAAGDHGGADISFAIPLAAAPTAHVLAVGASPTPACPGTASAPSAAAGQLCIYEGFNNGNFSGLNFQDPVGAATSSTVETYGAALVGSSTGSGAFTDSGGWAVTAP